MELMKPGTEVPRATMWGTLRQYADPEEDEENKLPMTLGFTANVPLFPIFNDLMQMRSADEFYNNLQDMIDEREREREEEVDMEEESSSGSEDEVE